MATVYPQWEQAQINDRVAAAFKQAGVDPTRLLEGWTLSHDGVLRATAVLRLAPAEMASLLTQETPPTEPTEVSP